MSDHSENNDLQAASGGSSRRGLSGGRKALLVAVVSTLAITAVLVGGLAWAFWVFAHQSGVSGPGASPEPISPAATLTPTASSETTPVPDVVTMSFAAASERLRAAGFKVGAITSVYVDGFVVGSVVAQSPGPAAEATVGSAVQLTVSKGTLGAELPKVDGLTVAQAKSALAAAGLSVSTVNYVYSDKVASGIVMSLATTGDHVPKRGESVSLTVSKGLRPVAMPVIVGLSPAAALKACQAIGVGLSLQPSGTKEGIVYRQSPSAGSGIVPGRTASGSLDLPPRPSVSARITRIDPTWEKYNKQLGAHITCTSTSTDDRGLSGLHWQVQGLDVSMTGTGNEISFILPGYRRYGSTTVTLSAVDSAGQTTSVRKIITVDWDKGTLK